jgi:hypothetical protein
MKTVVDWVLAQRRRLIVLAVAAAPLFPVVTAALLALETARRGVAAGLTSAALGVGVLAVLGAILPGTDVVTFAVMGLAAFLPGVAIGALLRSAGNLMLAFQGAVLFSLLAVAAISLFWPDPQQLFAGTIEEVVEVLRGSGASDEQVAIVRERGAMVLLGGAVFSQVIGALLLGYWWVTLASGERRFGAEFRALKLGRVLGAAATALVLLSLVFDAAVVQNLTPLALLGFVFQGLAVLHAWAHAKRWHPGLLAPVYVLLVTPLTVVVVLGLSVIGLVDNWFNLRRSLPQA